MSGMRLVSGMR